MVFIHQLYVISKRIIPISTLQPIAWNNKYSKLNNFSRNITTSTFLHEKTEIKVTFINQIGDKIEAKGKVGDSLIQIAVKNSIFLPHDLCDGDLRCDVCNFTFSRKNYERLPKPSHAEMIYLNSHRYPHWSRMGCQIKMTKDLDALEVEVSELCEELLSLTKEQKRRFFSRDETTCRHLYGNKEVSIVFINTNGDKVRVKGRVGDTMMDIALKNAIFRLFGECEGYLACYKCIFIFTKKDCDRLPKSTIEENGYLRASLDTSRMGCAIIMTEDLDGIEVKVTPNEV